MRKTTERSVHVVKEDMTMVGNRRGDKGLGETEADPV